MNNEKPKPDYDGQREYLLPGNLPALKPMKVKEPVEPSPKISDADMSASVHGGMVNASRRMKIVQSLDIFLQHNPAMLDAVEAFVVQLTSNDAA